jgi:hypothetical protein
MQTIVLIKIPEIFNKIGCLIHGITGAVFSLLSEFFIKVPLDNIVKISMYGKGRAIDNIFVERLKVVS